MAPFLATRDYNRDMSSVVFRYSRCDRCGLVSLMNAPIDLHRYYDSTYHAFPTSMADIERRAEHEQFKIDLVQRFVSRGRLLEIGPSWGAFCLLAKRAGFEVEAIETDSRCREFLATRIGVRAIDGSGEAATLSQASVADVIALWHVVEHLRDPWALIARAAERLGPGGVLVVATPNPAALQFRMLGRFWAHIDAPRHVHLLPPALLHGKVRALGLEKLLCTTTDAGSLECNKFGWSQSLANFAATRAVKRALRLSGRIAARILAPMERRDGLGSAYTAVYRKPTQ